MGAARRLLAVKSVAFALIVLALGACASRPTITSAMDVEGAFKLPVADGGTPFVITASIDGSQPVPIIVDTGSTATALYPRGLALLNEEPEVEQFATVWGIASSELRPQITVPAMGIGSAERREVRAVLLEQPSSDGDIAGLVGLDFLEGYAMLWLPEEAALTFIPSERLIEEAFAGWEILSLRRDMPAGKPRRLVTTDVRLSGRTIPALIDTGAVRSFINWDAAEGNPILRLYRRRMERRWRIEGAVGSFDPRLLVTFERVLLGRQEWRDADLLVAELSSFDPEGDAPSPLIIIGSDFWQDHGFLIDVASGRLFLRPINHLDDIERVITLEAG